MIPASAPPRVHARLSDAADGPVPVVHRGAHAVYVDLDGWCVGVVDQHATRVPCALLTRSPDLGRLGGGPAEVRAGVLHLSGVPLVVGRLALRDRAPGPHGGPARGSRRPDPLAAGCLTSSAPVTDSPRAATT